MEALYITGGAFGAVFTILGVVFFTFGVLRTRPLKNWEATTGIIIKKELNININLGKLLGDKSFIEKTPDYYPTFQYVVGGKTYESTSKVHQEPGFSPGKEVEVLYDPAAPQNAVINSFVQKGTLFTLLGGIFLSIGLLGLLAVLFGFLFFN